MRRKGCRKTRKEEEAGAKLDEGEVLGGALAREVEEESGFLINASDSIAYYESEILGLESRYPGSVYVVLFGIGAIISGKLKLSYEHDDARWCTYSEFMGLNLTAETGRAATVLEERLVGYGVH